MDHSGHAGSRRSLRREQLKVPTAALNRDKPQRHMPVLQLNPPRHHPAQVTTPLLLSYFTRHSSLTHAWMCSCDLEHVDPRIVTFWNIKRKTSMIPSKADVLLPRAPPASNKCATLIPPFITAAPSDESGRRFGCSDSFRLLSFETRRSSLPLSGSLNDT